MQSSGDFLAAANAADSDAGLWTEPQSAREIVFVLYFQPVYVFSYHTMMKLKKKI